MAGGEKPIQRATPSRVDFSKLEWGTLRKYQSFFYMRRVTDSHLIEPVRDKSAIVEAVRAHFESQIEFDHVDFVAKFLRFKKDDHAMIYGNVGNRGSSSISR